MRSEANYGTINKNTYSNCTWYDKQWIVAFQHIILNLRRFQASVRVQSENMLRLDQTNAYAPYTSKVLLSMDLVQPI